MMHDHPGHPDDGVDAELDRFIEAAERGEAPDESPLSALLALRSDAGSGCADAEWRIAALSEDALAPSEVAQLTAHLEGCPWCSSVSAHAALHGDAALDEDDADGDAVAGRAIGSAAPMHEQRAAESTASGLLSLPRIAERQPPRSRGVVFAALATAACAMLVFGFALGWLLRGEPEVTPEAKRAWEEARPRVPARPASGTLAPPPGPTAAAESETTADSTEAPAYPEPTDPFSPPKSPVPPETQPKVAPKEKPRSLIDPFSGPEPAPKRQPPKTLNPFSDPEPAQPKTKRTPDLVDPWGTSSSKQSQAEGRLNVNCVPYCPKVVVDGKPMGASPLVGVRLAPGYHDVVMHRSDDHVDRRRVKIRSGKVTSVVSRRSAGDLGF